VLLWLGGGAGCAFFEGSRQPEAVPEIHPGILAGYLAPESLPDSLALLPPPPSQGSAGFALDEEISGKALALRGTSRWALAVEDAELHFPAAADAFSCALRATVTESETPHLYMLLRRTLTDAGLSTYAAKNAYERPRPFMTNEQPICTPQDEAALAKDGSYPSGHTSLGWAWALLLTEIAPDRTDALLERGRAFGESRVVCNVHWQSDVLAGRFMGAATLARLHADAIFRKDLEVAKREYAQVRSKGLEPARDCEAEAEALAVRW
jgi:acid phosphatase (class A)